MSRSINKCTFLGNIGKDPEIRTTASGTTVANFSIATSDRYKDASGNWVDKTEWISCIAFKRTAEIIRDYVRKGTQIYVEGKLQNSSWDDKTTGQKRYKTEIMVQEVILLSGPKQGEQSRQSAPVNQDAEPPDITDDEIPF